MRYWFSKICESFNLFTFQRKFLSYNFQFGLAEFLQKQLSPKTSGASCLFIAAILVAVFSFYISVLPPTNPELVINSAQIVKRIQAVAGGQPVKYSVLVKRVDITSQNYLAKLPKQARSIKISQITANQAESILKTPPQQLSLESKVKLATANQPRSFFAASLIDSVAKYFLSSLEDGAEQLIEEITQPEVQETSDAVVVDLSDKALEKQEKKEEKEQKEEKEEIKGEEKIETEFEEPVETGALVETPSEEAVFEEPSEISPTSDVGNTIESLTETTSPSDQPIVQQEVQSEKEAPSEEVVEEEFVEVDYEIPAPTVSEQETETGKIVTVSAQDRAPSQPVLTDVLTSTKIPEIYKVGQENKIKIKWTNEKGQEMAFHAYDTDNNGKLDYVEWTVPHLSIQTFEIIFISKALELDENNEPTADIYDLVVNKDNQWTTVSSGHTVKVTFKQILDNTKDITIYAKPSGGQSSSIEVYDANTDQLVTTFLNIDHEDYYKVLLTNLQSPSDVFNLKITGDIDFDQIVDPTGWLTGWAHRKKITISNTNVGSDLTNFPTLVKISSDADLALALATGYDIRFTDSGGSTLLKYERESWTGGGGASVTANFWVKVPTVSSSASTELYVYYGKSDASDGQDATNVWDANYKGVWHLGDSASPAQDSTSNNNDGTQSGGVTFGATGKIDGATSFDGADDYIDAGNVITDSNLQYITFSTWINPTTVAGNDGFFNIGNLGNTNGKINLSLYNSRLYVGINGDWQTTNFAPPSEGVWTHLSFVLDETLPTDNLKVYYNDSLIGSMNYTTAVDLTGLKTLFGIYYSTSYTLTGLMDEIRVSNSARSADWINFEYHNQGDAGNNLTFANQENNLTWLSGWNNRKKITIDHTKVGSGTENEINFPVLISLTGLSGINANGTDIRFTSDDGGTYLAREIESYSSGTLTAWVKIPTLSYQYDTVIYMYYGNASATEPAADSTYGKNNVWDANFKGVWHLGETGTNPTVNDSTSNANNSTTNLSDPTTSGKINGATAFITANSDYINTGSGVGKPAAYTIGAWIKPSAYGHTGLVLGGNQDSATTIWGIFARQGGNVEVWVTNGATYQVGNTGQVWGAASYPTGAWTYITATVDGSFIKYYKNGTQVGSDIPQTATNSGTATNVIIGANAGTAYFLDGSIDETRISSTARSAGWIATEYANQNSPSTFYTAGNTEGTEVPQDWLTGWSNRKKITIKNGSVDETLTDFPLLVKFASNADLAGALATGYDLRFTSNDGTTLLSYERESWTGGGGTSATANIWVKIPSISATVDTDIYMYYGNSSATDGQSATSVWDANYKGVWHMNNNAANTTVSDSTSNANTGTAQQNTSALTTTGKNDGALTFNGTSDYIDIPANASLSLGTSVTVSVWFNRQSSTANQTLVSSNKYYASGYNGNWLFRVTSGSALAFASYDGQSNEEWKEFAFTINNDVWNYATISINGTTATAYLNGVASASGTLNHTKALTDVSVSGMRIGDDSNWTNQFFQGLLDEPRVSSTARSAGWIKFEYANQSSADNELIIEGYTNTIPGEIVWTNGNGDNLWSTAGNWQGGVVPGTSDTVVFNSSAVGNVTIDTDISVKGINIASGYTGTITQSASYTVTLGTEGYVQAGGTFSAGSGGITDSGNWSATGGTFTANTSTVTFSGTSQLISGSTTFYNLTKSVTSADTLTFTAGTTQTISNTLTLNGASGQLLSLRSSSTGTQWNINPQATRTLSYLDVKDSNNTNATAIAFDNSLTDSGNNINWTFDSTPPVVTVASPTNGANYNSSSVSISSSATDTNLGSLVPNLDSSLVSWWRMEDNAGNTTVTDYMGANNGTSQQNTSALTTTGKLGKAMTFNGTSDCVSLPSANAFKLTNSFSVSSWVKYNSSGTYDTIFESFNGYPNAMQGILIQPDQFGKVHVALANGGGAYKVNLVSNASVNDNIWHNIIWTFDGNTHKIYIDNLLDQSTSSTELATYQSTNYVRIGCYEDSTYSPVSLMHGSIDDVQIYNRALTSDEITALYNGTAISHSSTLADGSHTYKAYAQDLAGNVGVSSTNTFSVDTVNPPTPSASPAGGTYDGAQSVTLSSSGSSAIYYTLNGDTPTTGSTLYTTPISISTATTLKALAVDLATNQSGVMTESYTFDVTAPTTSATATSNGSSYTFNTWTGSNISVTLSCTDNIGGVGCETGYPKYCLDTANTCTPTTSYTTAVSISTEGTSYIRYYSTDTIPNTETTNSSTLKIDKTAPTTTDDFTNNDTWVATNQTITLTPADATSGISWTKYCTDIFNTCSPATGTAYTTPVTISDEGSLYFRYASQDNAGNTQTTVSKIVRIDKTVPVLAEVTAVSTSTTDTTPDYTFSSTEAGTITYSGACTSITTSATAGNNTITFRHLTAQRHSNCTITVTDTTGNASAPLAVSAFEVAAGGSTGGSVGAVFSQIIESPVVQQIIEAPQQVAEQVSEQITSVAEQITVLLGGQPESEIFYPPIEEVVTEEAPVALQGWNIMDVISLGELALTPINSDITFFADKIPQLKQTLLAFGIDVNNVSDAQKISGVEMYLPGLTQVALSQDEILAINKFGPDEVPPVPDVGVQVSEKELEVRGELAINEFASVQGVPLTDFSPNARQRIPNDIVFVRDQGEMIDYSIAISVDSAGQVRQKINTMAGRAMELVIKPDQPARSVTGFMTLKKVAVGQTKTNVLGYISKILTASLITPTEPSSEKLSADSALLLNKFAYAETLPGIYVASIDAPRAEGEYDMSTVIEYKDINLAPKETKMAVVVNPEGYVFSQMQDGKLRVKGASVSLYWLNPQTNEYELWPADKFSQKNPILTDDTGKYSFLVPKGTYKIKATATNYSNFESEPFVMKEDIMVNKDIELFKKTGWFDWLNWQNIITFLLVVLITSNLWQDEKIRNIILKIFKKRSKINEKN